LLNQKENLEQFAVIKNVFKSKTYSLPYINDDLPETSALNKNSYPNWWVSAVGADNLVYDGSGIKVAVIDTGIYEHPDLNIGAARSFVSDELPSEYQDDYGHGTHVAGIIGSNGYSSGGTYRGIAPGVTLINAKAGSLSSFDDGDIINAIQWSVNTEAVDIISMSFGDINPVANDPLTLALSAATDNGVICVSSAGNSGPSYISGGSPASGIDVISVGASDSNNNLASFSSWGPTYSYLNYPDIVAPGVNIISTEAPKSLISDEKRFVGDYFDFSGDADYIPLSGTSMSCPMVAGALAILKQAYPNLTPETARIALLEGASKLLNEDDNDEMKSGFGLINISNSLNFLNQVNITHPNINDIAIIAPKELPVAPFDLLNFPGDSQLYNLTVISGDTNNFNINIPSKVDGLTLTTDKSQLSFTDAGVSFIGLQIDINHNAMPGLRLFTLNMTSGADLYYEINISISIKYPEFRILLDSYHGLNDWSPLASVYQMSFYDWMRDITDMDIAIDYLAEYWTPNYNKSLDNSLLTEEKLAQYDIVVLQNPIIPYTPLEITNLKNYYENGGNMLFLGTR
jgi:subtilisin family serine protease